MTYGWRQTWWAMFHCPLSSPCVKDCSSTVKQALRRELYGEYLAAKISEGVPSCSGNVHRPTNHCVKRAIHLVHDFIIESIQQCCARLPRPASLSLQHKARPHAQPLEHGEHECLHVGFVVASQRRQVNERTLPPACVTCITGTLRVRICSCRDRGKQRAVQPHARPSVRHGQRQRAG